MLTKNLISELKAITVKNIETAEKVFSISNAASLNFKTSEKSWSVLECLEHLNLYGDFYNSKFNAAIAKGVSKKLEGAETFHPGKLGDYFAKMMKVGEESKMKKYPAFKSKNPSNFSLPPNVLERFISQQKEMLEILNQAQNIDLEKVKIPTTISMFLKLKLGDGLRFVIYHNERHVIQASRALAMAKRTLKAEQKEMV
jgi:hypothetical protein